MSELVLNSGESFVLHGEVEVGGSYYQPESGSLNLKIYSIFDEVLLVQGEGLNYPYSVKPDQLPLNDNSGATGFKVSYSFISNGIELSKTQYLVIEKSFPVLFTKNDIINSLNASGTLTESDIDLAYAYKLVESEVGNTFMTDPDKHAMDSRLVFLKATMQILPTFSLRVLKTKRIDDHSETRFDIDGQRVMDQLQGEYNKLLSANYDIESETDTLVNLVAVTDIITGDS